MRKQLLFLLVLASFLNMNAQLGFEFHEISELVDNPYAIFSADIDGDGDLDVLSASTSDDKVAWYENIDGQGTFGEQNIIVNLYETRAVYAADMDGDGDMDVLTASYINSGVFWIENIDGLGTFGSLQLITIFNESVLNVSAADFDGDGDMDVLTADHYEIVWLENVDGAGNFGIEQEIDGNTDGVRSLHAIDIDGDGDLDVVSSEIWSNKIVWYENLNGLGSFGSAQIISLSADYPASIFSADLDGDNDIDVLSASKSDNTIAWYENIDGMGTFSPEKIIDIGLNNDIIAGDIDGDGDNDVIAVTEISNTGLIWFENIDGLGNFGVGQNITGGDSYGFIATDDIDGDGDLDIISAGSAHINWHENLGNVSNEIYGIIRSDLDNNGCDSNDFPISNLLIVTENSSESYATFSLESGLYQLFVQEGDFTTTVSSSIPSYYTTIPASQETVFVGVGGIDQVNFCIEPNQTVDDLNIALYPLSDARPGFNSSYELVYRNVGTTLLTGNINLMFNDSKISFLTASETPSSQTSNSLTFDYDDLSPFQTRTIELTFNVAAPPITEIGDILLFTSEINPITGDFTENDNTFLLDQTVIGSFDPNDIQVLEGDQILLEDADEYLHYIIRFQNTGTAEAIDVRVTNILDPNLDWNTIQLENVSHSNRVEIVDGNQISFIFEDINLPDSTTNEPESHGYIQYKIKPIGTIAIGDSMSNNANIFFDFNAPILTNTVTTTVVEILGVYEATIDGLSIYPNPSDGILNIKSNVPIVQVHIHNQLGQLVLEENNFEGIETIQIDNLNQGLYFVQLKDANSNSGIQKLLKN